MLAVAFALACGGHVPTVAPTPLTYPNMLGGWTGILTTSWAGEASGSLVCNARWVVDTQGLGHFSGTLQVSGTANCSSLGTVSGVVQPIGLLDMDVTGVPPQCTYMSGNQRFNGAVSPSFGLTVQRLIIQRSIEMLCPDATHRTVTTTMELTRPG